MNDNAPLIVTSSFFTFHYFFLKKTISASESDVFSTDAIKNLVTLSEKKKLKDVTLNDVFT
jgi:hypothetical protein